MKSVYKDAIKISIVIFILTIIEIMIFAIFKGFKADIIIGGIYGFLFTSLSFFYLAFCVNKAVDKTEAGAKAFMGMTYTTRMILTAIMVIIAAKVKIINIWAAIIPLLFQRIAVYVVEFLKKRGEKN